MTKHAIKKLAPAMLLAAIPMSAYAEDELDDLLGGFEGDALTEEILNSPRDEGPLVEGLTGSAAISTVYNIDDHRSTDGKNWSGFSKLRGRLNLQYDRELSDNWDMRAAGYMFYDVIYHLRDRDEYSNEVLGAYESEADTQELWLRGKLRSDLDIKIGRQVVNWGRADSLRVLDILNPLDAREPGLADIEDIRLPVTMIKTDYYIDSYWSTSFIVIPEMRFTKTAPYGSDFATTSFKEHKPEHISDSSYAAAVNGIFSGWDISFHAARYWRDTPYVKFNGPLSAPTFEHSRLTMLGTGGNYTEGAWLFKGELAWFDDIDYTLYTPNPGPIPPPSVVPFFISGNTSKNRVDALVGIEYFGIADTTFALEAAHQYIPDFDDAMKPGGEERNSTALALRATHSMINDRLDLQGLLIGSFEESGSILRLDAEYELRDALSLSGGLIFYYEGEDPPFDTYFENDRLFGEIKYSF